MKRIICALLLFMMLGSTALAAEYDIINMSEFENVTGFSEGLCAAQDKNTLRWGFIDENKNWVIEPRFQRDNWFKGGHCVVNTIDGKTVVIDTDGEVHFSRSTYYINVDSESTFITTKDGYVAIWQKPNPNEDEYTVQLADDKGKVLDTGYVILYPFDKPDDYKESSKSFFQSVEGIIYNYKCVDITDKLFRKGITIKNKLKANDKYIVGTSVGAGAKLKCFDIDGNIIAEFDRRRSLDFHLSGDLIVCEEGDVYNIPEQKKVFDGSGIEVDKVREFYGKYFTVKKKYGTTALYTLSGELIIDFGVWGNIYPTFISDRLLVSTGKWGVVDISGNVILPFDYTNQGVEEPLCGGGRYAHLIENGGYVYIDLQTLKKKSVTEEIEFGYKYHKYRKELLNSELDVIYTVGENEKIESVDFLSDGNVKISKKVDFKQEYSIIKFKDNGIKVELDNNILYFDVFPVVQDGRTLVPMRTIFEALGASVEWDGETKSIKAVKNDIEVTLQLGSDILVKNGKETKLDVVPQVIDGRTLVPVRAISDSFDIKVLWDGNTQTVSLYTY